MTTELKISDHFKLPLEAVTETFLLLGQRGSGKTNTAAVIAEELFAGGAPFAVMTPIDNWWGLKSSVDGKGPGLPIYIFGGSHADLPLQPTAGKLMADVLIEQRISCVLCTQGFSGNERAQFTTDFAERLLDKNRQPLHMIVEEADAFIPQKPFPGEQRMLGAMDRLIRWGRSPSGIGGTFISQRSAKINKDVTTQCSVLVAHRTMAEQDIDAINGWFKYHPDKEKHHQLLAEIATLPKGTAFLYSPAWLDHFGKIPMRRRHTFDSAATPKLGDRKIELTDVATVDLKVLEGKMAETIARVKADDPKELKKQIIDLKNHLEAKGKGAIAIDEKKLEQIRDQDYNRGYNDGQESRADEIRKLDREVIQLRQVIQRVHEVSTLDERTTLPSVQAKPSIHVTVKNHSLLKNAIDDSKAAIQKSLRYVLHKPGDSLPVGERACLIAIAQGDCVTREQIGILTGYKRSSRDAYIARLSGKGFIEIRQDGTLFASPGGIQALGNDYEPLPTGQLGLEPTPDLYVEHMVQVFQEVWRVLRKDGTVWLNIGDCYSTAAGPADADRTRDELRGYRGERLSNGRGDQAGSERNKTNHAKGRGTPINQSASSGDADREYFGPAIQPNRLPVEGLKPKDLALIPARLALALQADGWWVRAEIIWHKRQPMPESVKDRPTRAHEQIYLLTKGYDYFYDWTAIADPASPDTHDRYKRGRSPENKYSDSSRPQTIALTFDHMNKTAPADQREIKGNGNFYESTKDRVGWVNKRTVWSLGGSPYPEAHYATFPHPD